MGNIDLVGLKENRWSDIYADPRTGRDFTVTSLDENHKMWTEALEARADLIEQVKI